MARNRREAGNTVTETAVIKRKKRVRANGKDKEEATIANSDLISRDLSWLRFNERVLDQVKKPDRNIFERLKFLAITASNLDEFFMIRVGSLYNYIDYGKERVDYSGLREVPFKQRLYEESQNFFKDQNKYFGGLSKQRNELVI